MKLVEDYEDPEMQLVNFILRVETYVFLDHCRKHDNFSAFNSKDDITNLKNVKKCNRAWHNLLHHSKVVQ